MPGFLEELVALFGFEVSGLDKLKAAAKQFDAVKKNVVASANPLKSAGASAGVAAIGVGRLGESSKKSSRGVLLLSTALGGLKRAGAVALGVLRTVLAVVLRLAVGLAGAVTGGAAFAAMLAFIGAKAAMARRELQLIAKEVGSSAQNIETLGNIFRQIGLGDAAADEAKKVAKSMDEIAKSVRKGGDDAKEAKDNIKGFGIDKVFDVDKKTGQSRDSAALALDAIAAYKKATEKSAALRKQADALEKKQPKKAAGIRGKALEQDRKNEAFAESVGIDGKLKVLLDEKSLSDFKAAAAEAARLRPTTSDKSEQRQTEVAEQARQAGLKFSAVIQGIGNRFTDLAVIVAEQVLPGLNSFLDAIVAFAKRFGIIKENMAEKDSRERQDEVQARKRGIDAERTLNDSSETDTPQQRRNRTQVDAIQKGRQEDERRHGRPAFAPLPPSRPKDGLPGAPATVTVTPPASAAQTPVERTPTTVIRETQGELPAKLEALRKALDKSKPSTDSASLPARDKDTSPAPRDTPTRRIRDTQADLPDRLDALKKKPRAEPTGEASGILQQFKSIIDSIPSILQQVSPETNANKMQKAIENKTENDNRTYSDIGNDHRTISPSITVNATGLDAVAAAVKSSVLGAISTKGSNTSTGALTTP